MAAPADALAEATGQCRWRMRRCAGWPSSGSSSIFRRSLRADCRQARSLGHGCAGLTERHGRSLGRAASGTSFATMGDERPNRRSLRSRRAGAFRRSSSPILRQPTCSTAPWQKAACGSGGRWHSVYDFSAVQIGRWTWAAATARCSSAHSRPIAIAQRAACSTCRPAGRRRLTTWLGEQGVGGRVDYAGGSFFECVPDGDDCMLLKFILHDWNDARCRTILTTRPRRRGRQAPC